MLCNTGLRRPALLSAAALGNVEIIRLLLKVTYELFIYWFHRHIHGFMRNFIRFSFQIRTLHISVSPSLCFPKPHLFLPPPPPPAPLSVSSLHTPPPPHPHPSPPPSPPHLPHLSFSSSLPRPALTPSAVAVAVATAAAAAAAVAVAVTTPPPPPPLYTRPRSTRRAREAMKVNRFTYMFTNMGLKYGF